ncbi:MAG: preprotein translocase subunit SecA [Planctomycetia bacterium]|nr:preprotein translocase subunit SecA [Planctomycetia bacterium]
MLLLSTLSALLHRRRLKAVAAQEAELQALSDVELRERSLLLRHRARLGEQPRQLAVDAFALVREAARRALNMRHFDVQLLGGMTLVARGLAEMQTGEGKTLTATLPLYVYALYGRGAHLATVNDYLARRDADLMRPVYAALGLSLGVVESGTETDARRQAYACDVTYGTGKEFGFDFLRDRILLRGQDEVGTDLIGRLTGEPAPASQEKGPDKPVQRSLFFMLVDEADSVLIDDAGTPLVIAGAAGPVPPRDRARYRLAADSAARFVEKQDYALDPRTQRVELSFAGREKVRGLPQPKELATVGVVTLYEDVERAILVERLYRRDRNYLVRGEPEPGDSAIAIVDEFTGRVAEGRKWRNGLHQAIEAKEHVELTGDGGQAARVTVQEFFLRYRHLAGMSGTAQGSARELKRIYRLGVSRIPTNRPPIRKKLPTWILPTIERKWTAIVAEIRAMHEEGRPVLIGTRSIDRSQTLSQLLVAAGIEHEVLNAHEEAREAEIVARAGERGRVTVATNMAGRGTDIRLGAGTAELGGIHVIVSEMHEAARIDRQLVGRSGRQGDPGSYRYILSLEDDLLREGLSPRRAMKLKKLGAASQAAEFLSPALERWFKRAQRTVELRKFRQRKRLLAFEKQRNLSAQPLGLDPLLDLPG